jgi:hypothetical protein
VSEAHFAEGRAGRFGEVGGAIIPYHLPTSISIAVEAGDGPAAEDDHDWLLLIRRNLDVSETSDVMNTW